MQFLAKRKKKSEKKPISPSNEPKEKVHKLKREAVPDYYKQIMLMKQRRVSFMEYESETDQSLIIQDASTVPEEAMTCPTRHINVNLDSQKKDKGVKLVHGMQGNSNTRISIDLINVSEVKMPKVNTSDRESPLRFMYDYQTDQSKMFNSRMDVKLISSVPTTMTIQSPTQSQSPKDHY